MATDREFVHLHVHTDYSLLDGCCRTDRLCSRAAELGMKALSVTDHGVLFGLAGFYREAAKHGIKPLLGCEIYLVYEDKLAEVNEERAKQQSYHMGLLARNFTGYQNLVKLVSQGHVHGFYRHPRVDLTQLAAHSDGLIAFSGCMSAVIPRRLREDDLEGAKEACARFIDIFGKENFIIELMDHGLEEQRRINRHLVKLAASFGLRMVCTNDVHYVNQSDADAHDSLLCIQTGARINDVKRLRYDSRNFYLKSREEMEAIFGEIPEAITNTSAVAEMCELKLPFGENHYPVFEKPATIVVREDRAAFDRILDLYLEKKNALLAREGQDPIALSESERAGFRTNGLFLLELCKDGLKERYGVDYDAVRSGGGGDVTLEDGLDPVRLCDQLDYEIAIIIGTGFGDYFLIVWDFIKWARDRQIPVGPGRGSGAGCLVAYVLRITDVNPFRFGLIFERMLNLERVSPPDFDVDFCMRRRDEVVHYVREKYGADRVANIITFGTFGAKMIVRDLARVNDVSYGEADRIAKLVPDTLKITLADAVEKSAELRTEVQRSEVTRGIIEQGKIIEGMVRNTGKHACGIIIADQPITNLIPVTLQEGDLTTQYAKGPSEDLGLLKMDFLGLKNLTVIADCQQLIRSVRGQEDFDVEKVGFEDPATFQLLKEARTIGVFQLESGGMRALCRQLEVSNIDEIVALIALYRPGPMQFIPQYIKGKKDPASIEVPHELLRGVVEETYGILVYQEQVMEAARIIAGFTLGDADLLRRAMGKKIRSVMDQQQEAFVAGAARTNGIGREEATRIFDILARFAEYGFNKSHSAAYAVISYRTAYLKANYPVEFMAALLSSELGKADKVSTFVAAAKSMGIEVMGPDVNESGETFTPVPAEGSDLGRIRFGLAAIKGVGDHAAEAVVAERRAHGPFADFRDFASRIDTRACNRRVLECLIKTGAFDSFGVDRQHLLDSLTNILNEVVELEKDRASGQANMFDLLLGSEASGETGALPTYETGGPVMGELEKLQLERELLGFYLSGHPMEQCRGLDLPLNSFTSRDDLTLWDRQGFRLLGVINGVVKRLTKRDNRPWAYFTLSTIDQNLQVNLFPDAYEANKDLIEEGALVAVTGEVRHDSEQKETKLNGNHLSPVNAAFQGSIERLTLYVDPHAPEVETFWSELADYLHAHEGATELKLGLVVGPEEAVLMDLASSLSTYLTPDAWAWLREHPAVLKADLKVRPAPVPQRWSRAASA